jgi:hypothetical protein
MKTILQSGTLLIAMAISVFAADPTGKWAASMPGRGGDTMTVTFNLKADGDKLTGSVSNPRGDTEISDGKIDGDNISFSVVREFNGNTMKTVYKGTIEGDTIHFSMMREGGPGGGGPGGGERKFDAKKQ